MWFPIKPMYMHGRGENRRENNFHFCWLAACYTGLCRYREVDWCTRMLMSSDIWWLWPNELVMRVDITKPKRFAYNLKCANWSIIRVDQRSNGANECEMSAHFDLWHNCQEKKWQISNVFAFNYFKHHHSSLIAPPGVVHQRVLIKEYYGSESFQIEEITFWLNSRNRCNQSISPFRTLSTRDNNGFQPNTLNKFHTIIGVQVIWQKTQTKLDTSKKKKLVDRN